MQETTQHKSNLKHIFKLCFLLFALSPCIVKGELINIDYKQPFSQSKTTVQSITCLYSNDEVREGVSTVKQIKLIPVTVFSIETMSASSGNEFIFKTELPIPANNSPPKYILYKRLRLDLI